MYEVAGKSISDILSIDYNTFNILGLSDMRKVVGRLVSAGNKRIRRFENANESSPALNQVYRSGGAFSTKGKNLNQLRSEFARAKNFLEAKTSTRKGWRAFKKETIEGLKKKGVNITEKQFDKVWQSYEKLKEISPEVSNRGLKYAVLKDISDMTIDDDINADDIVSRLQSDINDIYERNEGLNYDAGVSGFFEIE